MRTLIPVLITLARNFFLPFLLLKPAKMGSSIFFF